MTSYQFLTTILVAITQELLTAFHWTANRDTSIDRPSPVNTNLLLHNTLRHTTTYVTQ